MTRWVAAGRPGPTREEDIADRLKCDIRAGFRSHVGAWVEDRLAD